MVKAEYAGVINRPVRDVFDYLTDPANEPLWQDGVAEANFIRSASHGENAEIFEKRRFLGLEMISKLQVTGLEPNRLFACKVSEGPVPFEITEKFEPVDGGTRVSMLVQEEPGNFFKLSEGMVQAQLQSQLAADFERAKEILESR